MIGFSSSVGARSVSVTPRVSVTPKVTTTPKVSVAPRSSVKSSPTSHVVTNHVIYTGSNAGLATQQPDNDCDFDISDGLIMGGFVLALIIAVLLIWRKIIN